MARKPTPFRDYDPYLYRVYTELRVDGALTDLVVERTGFRSFKYTDGTFFLNGEPIALRGVNKHQETEASAAAVRPEELIADWQALDELGVNAVRLAHYPHAALEYDQADERGILVWADNGHSNRNFPTAAGVQITREMVYQHCNHPAIVFWSVGNETAQSSTTWAQAVDLYASTVKQIDTSRPVVYAEVQQVSKPANVDILFRNLYQGWYGTQSPWAFEDAIAQAPYVSETGAGGVISAHQPYGAAVHRVNTYEPEEYQQLVLESRFQTAFVRRPADLPAFFIWVFRDFGDNKYKRTNTKGLLTYAGHKKDVYFSVFGSARAPLLAAGVKRVSWCGDATNRP